MKMYEALIVAALGLCIACTKSEMKNNKLTHAGGNWLLESIEQQRIEQSGNVTNLVTAASSGSFHFYKSDTTWLLDCAYTDNGDSVSLTQRAYWFDQQAERFFISGGDCYDCDMVFNVEEQAGSYFVLSQYEPINSDIAVIKKTYTLRRN